MSKYLFSYDVLWRSTVVCKFIYKLYIPSYNTLWRITIAIRVYLRRLEHVQTYRKTEFINSCQLHWKVLKQTRKKYIPYNVTHNVLLCITRTCDLRLYLSISRYISRYTPFFRKKNLMRYVWWKYCKKRLKSIIASININKIRKC